MLMLCTQNPCVNIEYVAGFEQFKNEKYGTPAAAAVGLGASSITRSASSSVATPKSARMSSCGGLFFFGAACFLGTDSVLRGGA